MQERVVVGNVEQEAEVEMSKEDVGVLTLVLWKVLF